MKHTRSLNCALLLFIALNCASCATKPIAVAYNCPQIVLPPDPVPATKRLTAKSNASQVMKAWVATAYAYRGWNLAVRKQIENSK